MANKKEAAKRYRVQMVDIKSLPWQFIRAMVLLFRRIFFTYDKPANYAVKVEADIEEVEAILGRAHFMPWNIFSYHYEGEDLNMMRPYISTGDYRWKQLHVRGFELDDGIVGLKVHQEPSSLVHPKSHLNAKDIEYERAANKLKRILPPEIQLK